MTNDNEQHTRVIEMVRIASKAHSFAVTAAQNEFFAGFASDDINWDAAEADIKFGRARQKADRALTMAMQAAREFLPVGSPTDIALNVALQGTRKFTPVVPSGN